MKRNRIRLVSLVLAFVMLLPVLTNVKASANDNSSLENTTIVGEDVRTSFDNLDLTLGRSNIDENWKFHYGDLPGAQNMNFDTSNWENINLPHDYSLTLPYTKSGEAESGYKLGGIGWYRKTINVGENLKDKRFVVDFGGVYMNASIYINGKLIGTHPYGYSPFAFDLTEYIEPGENLLAVKVDHQFPSSRWYSGSGIYRSVHLTVSNQVHVDRYGVSVTTPKINEQFESRNIDTHIVTKVVNNEENSQKVSVKQEIREKESQTIVQTSTSDVLSVPAGKTVEFTNDLKVNNVKAWDLKLPFLYEVVTTVLVDDKASDQVVNEIGYRTIRQDPKEGFFLNGNHIKLQGVSMHHDQGSLGSAAHYRAIERQVEILQEMGVNAIRVTHNPAADELIEIANRKGMMIIDELFDTWVSPKNGNYNDFAKWFNATIDSSNEILGKKESQETWAEFVTKQTISRGQNAPSIIMWSTGNEVMEGNFGPYSSYPQILEKIATWVQEIDTERFVTIGDNKFKAYWNESKKFGNVLTSLNGTVGMNYSDGRVYDNYHNDYPDWAIYGSETSSAINSRGIYTTENENSERLYTSYDTKAVPWGHKSAESWLAVAKRDFVAGEFIWTGFDYLGEPTNYNKINPGAATIWPSPKSAYFGIVDTAGFPKDRYYFYKSQWDKDTTTLHILPAWHNDVVNKSGISKNVRVNVFSNARSVELFFTPKGSNQETSLGKKTFDVVQMGNNYSYQIYTAADKSRTEYENLYLRWDVPYEDGTLRAVAYDSDDKVINETYGRSEVSTFDKASKLALEADRETINADGKDLSYITIDVKDSKDNLVANARNMVNVEVSGEGKLLALDNGDQTDHEPYDSGKRKALSGKLVAIVQSTKANGSFTVTASSEGLESGTVTVTTKSVDENANDRPVAYTTPQLYYVKAGTIPNLAQQVTVHYEDKEDQKVNVQWEKFETTSEGVYTVNGSLEGLGLSVKTTVVVIDEVGALLNYSTSALKGSGEVELPSSRPIVTRDGKVLDASYPVVWEKQDTSKYNEIGTYVVKGTAQIFDQKLDVTASIRISDGSVEEGNTNIATNYLTLTQDIEESLQSDNLLAIVDGDRNFRPVQSGPNTSVWTNYDAAQAGKKTSTLTFTFATAQVLYKADLHYYRDTWAASLPENVVIEYSADGVSDWKPIEFKETAGNPTPANAPNVTKYEYKFAPVSATSIRFTLTNKPGGNGRGKELCVGLTELELFTSTTKYEEFSTSELEELKVENVAVEGDFAKDYQFNIESKDIKNVEAKGKDNAAVTVLPEYNEKVIIITESEDNSNRSVYTLLSSDYESVDEVENTDEYKIYPKPQEMTYSEGGITLSEEANVVLESGLDKYTVDKVDKVLQTKGISKVSSEDRISTRHLNVLVGIKGSNGVVDKYFKENVKLEDHFDEIDAYQISIKGNVIAVLGKDTDAAFYGLTTLEHIFKQASENVVRQLTVNDFSSQEIRGVIEGYYGVPWTWERRADLLKFGADFKNNVMIFAPKDDPYHRDNWRELYPEDQLEKISELAKLGNETKNRFVWTIAPFHKQAIASYNYDESIEILKKKLDQLYDAGVRQFGVLRDDIASASGYTTVSRVMNDLKAWAETKDEKIYDFLFCPYSYTLEGWAWNALELNEYTKNFPDNVKLFFTGKNVCSPITQEANEQFMTKGAFGNRRKEPLVWLNWPVNDVFKDSHGYMALVMGNPKTILNTNVTNTIGTVTNPMQESYASYVAVFAIADYAWNTANYDADTSYSDGFTFIDSDASKELEELASHMASANGTIGIQNLPESENMKKEIAEFEAVMPQSDTKQIEAKGKNLKAKYQTIIDAVDAFRAKSKFEGLKTDLDPYITVLKEKSQAALKYIDAILNAKEGNESEATKLYDEAEALYEKSRSHKVQVSPNGNLRRADAGIFRINPNINNMRILAKELIDGDGEDSDKLLGDNIALSKEGSKLPLAIASWTNDIESASSDRVEKLNNGVKDFEGSLNDRWTNWTRVKRSKDWTGIIFGEGNEVIAKDVEGIKLGFFEDHGVSYPDSYTVEYYDGPDFELPTNPGHVGESNNPLNDDANWKEVTGLKGLNFRLNVMNTLSFDKVKTKAIRINMKPKTAKALAITEFEAYGKKEVSGPFKNPYITSNMIFGRPTNRHSIWSNYYKSNMIDANDATFTWWQLEDDTAKVGDHIGLDLQKVMKLGRFRFVMGGKSANDHYDKYSIIYSKDGVNWETYGDEIEQDTPTKVVDINLEGLEARYLAVKNLKEKPNWVQISEFMVETTEIPQEVDKSELEEKLEEAKDRLEKEKDLWTEESIKAVEEAISKAQKVVDDKEATQEQVNAAKDELIEALENVKLKPVNKEELQALVDEAEKIDLETKVPETVVPFEEALENAKKLLEDPKATQEQVNAAKDKLQETMDMLQDIPEPKVNKEELSEAIDKAEMLDLSNKTDESVENFNKALENAKEVFEDEEAKQESVDKATKDLLEAIENLTDKPEELDLEVLKEKIAKVKEALEKDLNPRSRKDLEEILKEAVELLEKENPSQEEINNMIPEIDNALENAVLMKEYVGYSEHVNVRETPNGKLLGSIELGKEITGKYDPENPNWLEIEHNDEKAYVYKELVSEDPIPFAAYSLGVNTRTKPNGEKVGELKYGTFLYGTINGKNTNWIDLEIDGQKVSVYKPALTTSYEKVYRTISDMNLRVSPNGKVLKVVPKGASLRGRVLVRSNWIYVTYEGVSGYIYMIK